MFKFDRPVRTPRMSALIILLVMALVAMLVVWRCSRPQSEIGGSQKMLKFAIKGPRVHQDNHDTIPITR